MKTPVQRARKELCLTRCQRKKVMQIDPLPRTIQITPCSAFKYCGLLSPGSRHGIRPSRSGRRNRCRSQTHSATGSAVGCSGGSPAAAARERRDAAISEQRCRSTCCVSTNS